MRWSVIFIALVLGSSAWAQHVEGRLNIQDVAACWLIDPHTPEGQVAVSVGFSLDRHGKVLGNVRLISAVGGDEAAQERAFLAARRAVLRCGSKGYDLPAETYDQWKDVEMTFDPQGLRIY